MNKPIELNILISQLIQLIFQIVGVDVCLTNKIFL